MTTELNDKDYVLLSAYIDGELAPTECRALEDRIAECPVLTRQFNIMAGQSVVLRNQSERLLHDRVYPDLVTNIENILDEKEVPSRHYVAKSNIDAQIPRAANSNTAIWTGIGAAAAVLIAFVGGNWFNENLAHEDVVVAANAPMDAQLSTFSPINNPVLDQEISLTLEKTLSGEIRHVALAARETTSDEVLIEPLRTFRQGGRFCREYHVSYSQTMTGTAQDGFYGRACRTGEGQWETVYRLIPGTDLPDLETPKQKL